MGFWGKFRGKRTITILIIAAVIVVLGATAFVTRKNMLDASRCEEVSAFIASEGEVVRTGEGAQMVGVIGDSYSAGDLLDDFRQGWAFRLPEYLDATVSVAGVGSTGFMAEGPCGDQPFIDRAAVVLATSPETLVIQGGLNDSEADVNKVAAHADELLRRVSSAPNVFVVGPTAAPAKDDLSELDETLRRVTEFNGGEYISVLDLELEFLPDDLHLTPAGHDELAAYVALRIMRQ